MSLNNLASMSFEELNLVVEVAKGELARRFKQFDVGVKVKVVAVDNPNHEFVVGRIGKINLPLNENNMYTVMLAGRYWTNWEFLPHELEPCTDAEFSAAENSIQTYQDDFSVLDDFGIPEVPENATENFPPDFSQICYSEHMEVTATPAEDFFGI